jgi:5-methylcytosine-specific restriction enzyme subunit McrC
MVVAATAPVSADTDLPADRYIGRIPVRNLWLLMLYASDLFRSQGMSGMTAEENPDDIPDLIAEILVRAVEKRLRTPLTRGYNHRSAVLSRVRGRVDLLATETHQLLSRGAVACDFDELTINTTRNRFVLGALQSIAAIVDHQDLAHRCRMLAGLMKSVGVGHQLPTRSEMSTERFGRNDSGDQIMLAAAKLALDLALPAEAAEGARFIAPDREQIWIRKLFERAVGGLYDVALSSQGWVVRCGAPLHWSIDSQTSGIESILPSMRTDVILDQPELNKRIVIDTKFNAILTKGWYRDESIRSGYLYQMYAYLRSQVGQGDSIADSATGMLLHPSVGDEVDETVGIQGHAIRFATVDLTASATSIRARILGLAFNSVGSSKSS